MLAALATDHLGFRCVALYNHNYQIEEVSEFYSEDSECWPFFSLWHSLTYNFLRSWSFSFTFISRCFINARLILYVHMQVTCLILLLYHIDWVGSIAFTAFMRLNHVNHLSKFIYLLVRLQTFFLELILGSLNLIYDSIGWTSLCLLQFIN